MQELLGRIARLDPSASLGLRVIACFDELVVGNVNTRALLSAAASLAGCVAGFRQDVPARTMRVTPKGAFAEGAEPEEQPDEARSAALDGITVWLERHGPALPNDAIILERLALAVRIRHGRARRELDHRRHLGVLTDRDSSAEERDVAATALGLTAGCRYRVATAPLFAVWQRHPHGPEDVIATRWGPIHAIVVPEDEEELEAMPCGVGEAATPDQLHRSFRTALVALRLCAPPEQPMVVADEYGGLIGVIADGHDDAHHPDVDRVAVVARHPWGMDTLAALLRTQTVREAARSVGVHHSTMQSRVEAITAELGFDPTGGFGRARLGTAFLLHRMEHSRALELPAPTR